MEQLPSRFWPLIVIFWSFGQLQSFRSLSPLSVAARIKSIRYRSKNILPKYQNWLEYFLSWFFSSLAQTNFSLSFYVSTHIWLPKFFKIYFSIDLHPWILLTSRLHVQLISLNPLQEKNTRNEYILEKTCKLSYSRVSVKINTK